MSGGVGRIQGADPGVSYGAGRFVGNTLPPATPVQLYRYSNPNAGILTNPVTEVQQPTGWMAPWYGLLTGPWLKSSITKIMGGQ